MLASADRTISGNARGGDNLGARWSRERGIQVIEFPAHWHLFDDAAGGIRNQRMVDEATAGVFLNAGTPGTSDCIERARKAGIPFVEYKIEFARNRWVVTRVLYSEEKPQMDLFRKERQFEQMSNERKL